jgi:hypothetical protein
MRRNVGHVCTVMRMSLVAAWWRQAWPCPEPLCHASPGRRRTCGHSTVTTATAMFTALLGLFSREPPSRIAPARNFAGSLGSGRRAICEGDEEKSRGSGSGGNTGSGAASTAPAPSFWANLPESLQPASRRAIRSSIAASGRAGSTSVRFAETPPLQSSLKRDGSTVSSGTGVPQRQRVRLAVELGDEAGSTAPMEDGRDDGAMSRANSGFSTPSGRADGEVRKCSPQPRLDAPQLLRLGTRSNNAAVSAGVAAFLSLRTWFLPNDAAGSVLDKFHEAAARTGRQLPSGVFHHHR